MSTHSFVITERSRAVLDDGFGRRAVKLIEEYHYDQNPLGQNGLTLTFLDRWKLDQLVTTLHVLQQEWDHAGECNHDGCRDRDGHKQPFCLEAV